MAHVTCEVLGRLGRFLDGQTGCWVDRREATSSTVCLTRVQTERLMEVWPLSCGALSGAIGGSLLLRECGFQRDLTLDEFPNVMHEDSLHHTQIQEVSHQVSKVWEICSYPQIQGFLVPLHPW